MATKPCLLCWLGGCCIPQQLSHALSANWHKWTKSTNPLCYALKHTHVTWYTPYTDNVFVFYIIYVFIGRHCVYLYFMHLLAQARVIYLVMTSYSWRSCYGCYYYLSEQLASNYSFDVRIYNGSPRNLLYGRSSFGDLYVLLREWPRSLRRPISARNCWLLARSLPVEQEPNLTHPLSHLLRAQQLCRSPLDEIRLCSSAKEASVTWDDLAPAGVTGRECGRGRTVDCGRASGSCERHLRP